MSMDRTIRFTLNGKPVSLSADPERMLLWVLRTDLGLTGTKFGCGEGFCGACTVIVNGEAVRSCQTPLKSVEGKKVLTIEGLEKNGRLHPLQEAFMKHDALQCGYCTPGMILTAYSLLQSKRRPGEKDILDALEGNLCRCGAHQRIVTAVQDAAAAVQGAGSHEKE
jgi:aerobic-type carbon monoxide dehydrogenase small subunit (CoxS/CutS family)